MQSKTLSKTHVTVELMGIRNLMLVKKKSNLLLFRNIISLNTHDILAQSGTESMGFKLMIQGASRDLYRQEDTTCVSAKAACNYDGT